MRFRATAFGLSGMCLAMGLVLACADHDDGTAMSTSPGDHVPAATAQIHRLPVAGLVDKIRGSWVGQMAGVSWAASTEFKYHGRIIPEDEVPAWRPGMVNAGYIQDDVYVEIPFLEAMAERGPTAGFDVLGEHFARTRFPLWHANEAARNNLRVGILAPDSGHYLHNAHCEDIDWQIEADFVGTMCPGLADAAVEIAWRTGHVIGYGDGVLGGVFLAAMHAEAFFARDVRQIVETGRTALPLGSKYRAVIDDVIAWYDAGYSWPETWGLLQERWGEDDRCPSYDHWPMTSFNIDAKLNGAYVVIGLLYGEGDFEESVRIAMRCGQDSDCNASSVGGILGNWLGFSGLPEEFRSALRTDRKFLFTTRTLDEVVAMGVDLAQEVVRLSGGVADQRGADGVWTLPPVAPIRPPILEQWPEAENAAPWLAARVAAQEGLTVEFAADVLDPDGVLAVEWYFGDLQRADGVALSHTYAAPGAYTVLAVAADVYGNTAIQPLDVYVNAPAP